MSVLDQMSVGRQVVVYHSGVFAQQVPDSVFFGERLIPNEHILPSQAQRLGRIKLNLLKSMFFDLVVTLTKSKNNRQKISSLHESLTLNGFLRV